MSGVFGNVYPPAPHRPASVAFDAGGGHTRWVERGGGVNSSEDARHCSVLCICKYFVTYSYAYCNNRAQTKKQENEECGLPMVGG
jgi:hypothetical protein